MPTSPPASTTPRSPPSAPEIVRPVSASPPKPGGRPEPTGGTVTVVFHEHEVGGATRAVVRVLPQLERLGWRFSFWVPGSGVLADELRDRGYRVAGLPRHLRYSRDALRVTPGARRRLASVPGYLRAFRSLVRDERPAVVHANTRLTIPEVVIARRAGVATVLNVHETFDQGFRAATAARAIRIGAHEVVAPSMATAARLARHGVTARVVPYGIDVPPSPVPQRGDRPMVVGTLGTVSRRKGSDTFVAAARALRDGPHGSQLAFRVVGPPAGGPEEPWARDLIRSATEAGIEHRVVGDSYAELREWDLFVLPAREDPFPLAVLEALASGLPVIGTRVDGIVEQLAWGRAGVLVPPDDAPALAGAIADLARSPERRAALGRTGRERVSRELTFERQAAGLDAAYRDALRARRAR